MARVRLFSEMSADLSEAQTAAYQWVVESRGRMIRPYEVLLHSPDMARAAAELGACVRFGSSLSDHDRELAILASAAAHSCQFEWDSHLPLAIDAGVSSEALAFLQGQPADLHSKDTWIIGFVQELCARARVPDDLFALALADLGEAGTVELCVTVGYYTMLAQVMGACQAC